MTCQWSAAANSSRIYTRSSTMRIRGSGRRFARRKPSMTLCARSCRTRSRSSKRASSPKRSRPPRAMPSLIDIRRRIKSVRNTQQITKAMKMVSAAKLRRAPDRVIAARPYAALIRKVLSNLAMAVGADEQSGSNPLLARRPEKRILLLLFTSDKGLAGAFNANLIKAAQKFFEDHRDGEIEMEAIGRKGRDFFRKRGAKMTGEHVGILGNPRFEDAAAISRKTIERFRGAEIDGGSGLDT